MNTQRDPLKRTKPQLNTEDVLASLVACACDGYGSMWAIFRVFNAYFQNNPTTIAASAERNGRWATNFTVIQARLPKSKPNINSEKPQNGNKTKTNMRNEYTGQITKVSRPLITTLSSSN